ncbi:MAG: metallophosphoesterase [Byssovorax sp.]
MTQIAHLSDFHLLDDGHAARRGRDRLRLSFLSFGRPRDHHDRRRRALHALVDARRSGAQHLVLTGDLTEEGLPAQFEVLGEVLRESGWQPARVTLVPGNHDAYAGERAWSEALAGPLAAYHPTSIPGVPVQLAGAVLLPLSTAVHQPVMRSAGAIAEGELRAASAAASDSKGRGTPLLVAMHHPPGRHPVPGMHWIDGLEDHAAIGAILDRHDHVHVLHGHTHVARERGVRPGGAPRIFSTEAVVESEEPLRVYRVESGRVMPRPMPAGGALALAPA